MSDSRKNLKRRMNGTVVSTKMDKTAVVRVDRVKSHPKYKKQYTVSKKYKAHDSKNEAVVGEKVLLEETRPVSKDKRWRIIRKQEAKK